MAAVYRASGAGGGSSGTGNRTAALVPAVNDLLLVGVVVSVNTNNAPTMTDNQSGTYTLVQLQAWDGSGADGDRMAVFVRDALCANTNSHTITAATGSNTAGEIIPLAFSGMTRVGAAAIRSSGKAKGAASASPSAALSQAALTGNPTAFFVGSGDTTTTPPTSWTERQDLGQTSPATVCEAATRDSGFTGTTITAAATQSTAWGCIVVELDGSAAPVYADPAFISSTAALYAPTFALAVDLGTIAAGSAAYAPTAALGVDAPTIAPTSALYAPEYALAVDAPTIAPGAGVYPPTVALAFDAPTIASTAVVYDPTAEVNEGEQVFPTHIASTADVYAPTYALAVDVPTIASGGEAYAPEYSLAADVPHIASGADVYAPSVVLAFDAPTLTATSEAFAPEFALAYDCGTIAPESAAYAPDYMLAVEVPSIASAVALFQPTHFIEGQSAEEVLVGFIASTASVYAPTWEAEQSASERQVILATLSQQTETWQVAAVTPVAEVLDGLTREVARGLSRPPGVPERAQAVAWIRAQALAWRAAVGRPDHTRIADALDTAANHLERRA